MAPNIVIRIDAFGAFGGRILALGRRSIYEVGFGVFDMIEEIRLYFRASQLGASRAGK